MSIRNTHLLLLMGFQVNYIISHIVLVKRIIHFDIHLEIYQNPIFIMVIIIIWYNNINNIIPLFISFDVILLINSSSNLRSMNYHVINDLEVSTNWTLAPFNNQDELPARGHTKNSENKTQFITFPLCQAWNVLVAVLVTAWIVIIIL